MPPDANRGVYSRLGVRAGALLEAVPEAVYVVDRAGRFVQWSDAFATTTGYDDDAFASLRWYDLVSDDSTEPVQHVHRVLAGMESSYYDTLRTAGDGPDTRRFEFSERPLRNDSGAVVGRVGVVKPAEQSARPEQFASFVDEVTDYAIFLLTPDGGVLTWNDGARRLKGYCEEEIVGQHFSVFYTAEAVERGVPDQILDRAREVGRAEDQGWRVRKDGSRFWADVAVTAIHDDDGTLRGFTKVTRDLTYRHEHEELITRQRDELNALDRLNRLIQTTVRSIVTESSQETMEQSVCDALAASELYQSAWIGDVEDDEPVLSVRCSAGDDGVLDALTDAVHEFGYSETMLDMIRAGEPVALSGLPSHEDVPEGVRQVAAAYDVGSSIVVPLAFGETLYGTLVVNSPCLDAFDDREQSAFQVLGVVLGFAINALRNRHLLFSDAIVELEFQTADREAFFSGVTREYDCRCLLEGQVLTENERTLQYVRVTGLPHEQVYELASEHETLEEVRLVSGDGDECLLEVVNTASGVQALVEAGAYVQSGVAEHGVATIRAEVAKGEDIRGVVKAFRRVYPDAKLVSKREHDRPARTAQTFRHELEQRLTKRQQTALRTAHLAGYFDWPRGSTAEEVAAAMDITSATLHYHLRRAQRELIDAYLDGEST
ncbi:hypothetical protein SAMN04487949_2067 [Halogranum gelatinilyticum]|uniref:PAS domain S-box-containing protein n=1 Tax=Halogranum gelatinilyticum TaxID=660521 RepID=A0A1G9U6V4_9EURY|nr:bacterio-opsin activator domain-containing protein [Halogranum gelatinilyticum]SDM55661.1 hypothetical protein SAMN04487949_2067 [Halogranum gelatinilyticum]